MLRAWGIVPILTILSASSIPSASVAAESNVQPAPSTIRVVARATIPLKPDQAELELGVTTDKKTAAAAVTENERKMGQVVAALKKEVGTDGEVKTAQVSVQPRFGETRAAQPAERMLGYTVTNTVHVRVANISAVGRLLDLAFQAGANTVERVGFTLKDPEAAQNQALRAASAKARARATAMAEGQGLRVGDVISVSEGETDIPFDLISGNISARRGKAEMTIEPGSVEVAATVTVVYALKAR